MVKEIDAKVIEQAVAKLVVETNKVLPEDLCGAICSAHCTECSALGKNILCEIISMPQKNMIFLFVRIPVWRLSLLK